MHRFVGLGMLLAALAWGAPSTTVLAQQAAAERYIFVFQDAEVRQVVEEVLDQAGVPFAIDPGVSGRTSFRIEQQLTREQLLAANKSLEEMAKLLEVDSLGFLSVDGLYWAMESDPRDPAAPQFTDHYFTGDYPTRLLDREIAEGRNAADERQLTFLVDA